MQSGAENDHDNNEKHFTGVEQKIIKKINQLNMKLKKLESIRNVKANFFAYNFKGRER
jgi:hypothetical protein